MNKQVIIDVPREVVEVLYAVNGTWSTSKFTEISRKDLEAASKEILLEQI